MSSKREPIYFYRGFTIVKNKEEKTDKKWQIVEIYDENKYADTIDDAKNAIDLKLGGTATAKLPDRWIKNEKLKKKYYEHFRIK
jgi:hypothetical protein